MMTLKRIAYTETETAGALIIDGFPFLVTLEDPWKENQPFVSCIPPGNYQCQRVVSPKFGPTFEVTGVPGRSHILFHSGNSHLDTQGCILLGKSFERIGAVNAIVGGRKAFPELLERLKGIDRVQLLVTG